MNNNVQKLVLMQPLDLPEDAVHNITLLKSNYTLRDLQYSLCLPFSVVEKKSGLNTEINMVTTNIVVDLVTKTPIAVAILVRFY